MAQQKRIQRELLDLTKDPIPLVTVNPVEDQLHKWEARLRGPDDSAYKGAIFKLSPTDYPFKPPVIKFTTKVYHCNVDDDGSICVDILKNDIWKPATKLSQVFHALVFLLEHPNPDDPLQPSIAELYKTDLPKYNKNVKDWIKKYCDKAQ